MAKKESIRFHTIPRFRKIAFLVHGFGTRFWKEADFANAPRFKRFSRILLNQVHSNVVHCVQELPGKRLRGDALVTGHPSVLLVIKTADCLPVFLVDEALRVVAAVHCGWKGTLQGVVQETVGAMKSRYESRASLLLAAMGPSIGPCCYEVGEDVRLAFWEKGFPDRFFRKSRKKKGKHFLDLRALNSFQLQMAGVKKENILSLNLCTACEKNLVSYRKHQGSTERMLSFIGLTVPSSRF